MTSRSSRNNARKHAATPVHSNSSSTSRATSSDTRDSEQPRQPQPSSVQRLTKPTLQFSPPAHLPTPLPDEYVAPAPSADLLGFAPVQDSFGQLMDFGNSYVRSRDNEYQQSTSLLDDDHYGEDDPSDNGAIYRSPPYREALRLPDLDEERSLPPLPILPRFHQQQEYTHDNERQNEPDVQTLTPSHARSSLSPVTSPGLPPPNSSGGPSNSASSSRTIRGYVPINNPAAAAPRVSRPDVGHAVLSPTDGRRTTVEDYANRTRLQQEYEREYEQAGAEEGKGEDDGGYYGYGYGAGAGDSRGYERGDAGHDYAFGSYPNSPPPPHPAALVEGWGSRGDHEPQQFIYPQDTSRYLSDSQQGRVYPRHPHPQPSQHQQAHRRQHSASERFMGSGLAQAIRRGAAAGASVVGGVRGGQKTTGATGMAGKDGEDKVQWAGWDMLNGQRILLIAYPATLQIWNCADLGALKEVLYLDLGNPEWTLMMGGSDPVSGEGKECASVIRAAILPSTGATLDKDSLQDSRPLLGMLLEHADSIGHGCNAIEEERRTLFVVYSLRSHQVVKMRTLPGRAANFEANERFIAIGTSDSPSIHILSSTTFNTLHIIPSIQLAPYAAASHVNISISPSAAALSITNKLTNTVQSNTVSTSSNAISINKVTNSAQASSVPLRLGFGAEGTADDLADPPYPVFALSGRLIAYASASPSSGLFTKGGASGQSSFNDKSSRRLSSSSAGSGPRSAGGNPTSFNSSSPFGFGLGRLSGMTQVQAADVGHAVGKVGEGAMKVGESVLGGMKFLGGMALDAARSRVTSGAIGGNGSLLAHGASPGYGQVPGPEGRIRAFTGPGAKFVSRSAPDENAGKLGALTMEGGAGARDTRQYSNGSTLSAWDGRSASGDSPPSPSSSTGNATIAPATRRAGEKGHLITVLDLGVLLRGRDGGNPPAPVKVAEFNASRSQPVVRLHFSCDGTSIAAVLRDGHAARVFKLLPLPAVVRSARVVGSGESGEAGTGRESTGHCMHVYDLYRGRTSAVIESVNWARDGRWAAVGTRNRTVHVFAINPYGGKPDVTSHIDGRVRNLSVLTTGAVKVHPLVRLRGHKSSLEQPLAPLAFTFLEPSDVDLPSALAYPFAPPPVTNSPSFSAPRLKRGTNYQDLLVFDPVDCVLSLRRLTIGTQAIHDQGGLAAGIHALGVTSISLPGMSGVGRLSSSSSPTTKINERPKLNAAMKDESQMELVAHAGVEATWDLRRGVQPVEIKSIISPRVEERKRGAIVGSDWLAEGEISTCSKSSRVLPRSLYLSHQFSFYALGEDYHALIRRYQFDIAGTKIEVRKLVEISTYASGGGDSSFVEGFSSPRDIRRVLSSFDEPIASAISGSFDNSNVPTILPMYPNGVPGSHPKSFRNSIPIRTMAGIGDGVSDGLERIKRGVKARSPQLASVPPDPSANVSVPVPLEFDEEDEDFGRQETFDEHSSPAYNIYQGRSTAHKGDTSKSAIVPLDHSTHSLLDADVVGSMEEDLMDGWDTQDKEAIQEAEEFHEFAVDLGVGGESEGNEDSGPSFPSVTTPMKMGGKKGKKRRG